MWYATSICNRSRKDRHASRERSELLCFRLEEGLTIVFEDEQGEQSELEFLGLIIHQDRRYGFFFPVSEDAPAGSSGEIVVLEVTELDEDDQPAAFELVEDESIATEAYEVFREATKDLYDFSD